MWKTFCFLLMLFSCNLLAGTDAILKRSNGLLRFVAKQEVFGNLALYSIMSNRCNRYRVPEKRKLCKTTVRKMIEILDFDIIIDEESVNSPPVPNILIPPQSFVFVAFKKNLLNLLSKGETTAYLRDVNKGLYAFATNQDPKVNIWDITLLHYKTPHLASRALAVLFQDTSHMKLHMGWLEKAGVNGSATFDMNKELLARVIDSINFVLDNSEDRYRKLFYPEEIHKDLNRNIYHFYVPMYLAMSLHQNGSSLEESYIAPLLLTLTYEFITSANDYRYVMEDPKNIQSTHKIKDIYGGYCGVNIGLRGMNFKRNFSEIQERFSWSTAEGVKLLLEGFR